MPVGELLLESLPIQPWAVDAACGKGWGPAPDDFFSESRAAVQAAMNFCNAHCTVREACLEDAMRAEAGGELRYGVRGGMSASGRRRLAVQRRAAGGAR
ncbi:WhiB family transcriptional regulator [Streptomyces sp. KC 17012]|jgi:hypothetical protein|uniref:WhiB family transcriptional regulator n=1 Tax=Streptomyces plumbidurans TaxID=2814589 RepID=UPI001C9DA43A|nr:WhiB family transcriptional regulator [Streptomyces plumbidurans]MBY8341864.1 WhiB family transcriptional regulator [Streptomyces plumbidurans]